MKTFASEIIEKYGLKMARNDDGDKIYTNTVISASKRRILTLESIRGGKECILKVRTYYKNGKIDSRFVFAIIDDVFRGRGGKIIEDYENTM